MSNTIDFRHTIEIFSIMFVCSCICFGEQKEIENAATSTSSNHTSKYMFDTRRTRSSHTFRAAIQFHWIQFHSIRCDSFYHFLFFCVCVVAPNGNTPNTMLQSQKCIYCMLLPLLLTAHDTTKHRYRT